MLVTRYAAVRLIQESFVDRIRPFQVSKSSFRTMATKAQAKASLGIISIGEMGLGVAKLLKAHDYRVLTNISGRSERTHMRAVAAKLDLVETDAELATQSDYIISIVPPRDAIATAERIATALKSANRSSPLYYLDLNAVSPASCREIEKLFSQSEVRFVDGAIIGGPPSCKDPQHSRDCQWHVPSMPMSGPFPLSSAPVAGPDLSSLLNARHISQDIGAASGLKMCFASLTKGFTALAVQSFTTAERLGVLPELKTELDAHASKAGQMVGSMTKMPPKAYRWVREMEEIADTHATDGGFGSDERIFNAIAAVYRTIAEDTVLGDEITEKRKRGMTTEDVAVCVGEGLAKRNGDR